MLTYLEPGDAFPPTREALSYPNGLLAAGGVLDSPTLLAAYERGIFPWYEAPQPVLWWSPDPRSVLTLDELHVSRSMRKFMRKSDLSLSADTAFTDVMQGCAANRLSDLPEGQSGTWIDREMLLAYRQLHKEGWAHSVEVWATDGSLAGGLYGIAIGGVFFGESMFSRAGNASKLALIALVAMLRKRDYVFIDCQVESEHLNSLGAKNLSRVDFETLLEHTVSKVVDSSPWMVTADAAALEREIATQ